jgi:hypothetical protein
METKKEIWIEQALSSIEGIKPQAVSASLKSRLDAIPKEVVILNQTIPMRAVWLTAASFALLFTMNFATIRKATKSQKQQTTLYSEYFSYLDQL